MKKVFKISIYVFTLMFIATFILLFFLNGEIYICNSCFVKIRTVFFLVSTLVFLISASRFMHNKKIHVFFRIISSLGFVFLSFYSFILLLRFSFFSDIDIQRNKTIKNPNGKDIYVIRVFKAPHSNYIKIGQLHYGFYFNTITTISSNAETMNIKETEIIDDKLILACDIDSVEGHTIKEYILDLSTNDVLSNEDDEEDY